MGDEALSATVEAHVIPEWIQPATCAGVTHFIAGAGASLQKFRYYEARDVREAMANHVVTLLLFFAIFFIVLIAQGARGAGQCAVLVRGGRESRS